VTRALALALVLVAACAGPARDPDSARRSAPLVDAGPAAPDAAPAVALVPPPPRWLRGSTHVHAAPSGDSSTAPAAVAAWYVDHGYDFIVLTDHNRVTIPGADPGGRVAADDGRLLVIAGSELTYNPGACAEPAPPPDGKCRVHVNALGVTARPAGKLEWADRAATTRRAMYAAAIARTAALGGVPQLNHPQWHWGLTAPLLTALAGDGVALVEIANAQFARWNAGDAEHPSMEALWDAALGAGATLWGVASDDAHAYDGVGRYPAGGAWVMVDAPRDADAIIAALAAGRFYASTGVALARAGVIGEALVVELADAPAVDPAAHTIEFIVDGRVVATSHAAAARHPIPPAPGYVRAVVTRADGAKAWVQPARR
jgi:hypothetical protein